MTTLDPQQRLMEVVTSINKLDSLIKKTFLEEDASSSSINESNLSIYLLIMEVKSSTIMHLSDTELQILDVFASHKALSLNELRKHMKLSRRWVSDKCKYLCELGFLSCTLRKHKSKGRPFPIYHVCNATVDNLDRAEAEYSKITNFFTPRYDKEKETPPQDQEQTTLLLWKCQKCGDVCKKTTMPQQCTECGDDRFSIYDPKNVDNRGSISKNISFG